MRNMETLVSDLQHIGIQVETDYLLKDCTTFRIGGPARAAAFARTLQEMTLILHRAQKYGVPVTCLGGGSNVLVSDDGIDGIVLLNRIHTLSFDGSVATVGSGYDWDDFVDAAGDKGLSGTAAMSGIPGSVGGAIYGNAGAYGECVSDRIVSITLIDAAGNTRITTPDTLGFGYRDSDLKRTGEIVMEATFLLEPGSREELTRQREDILATRRSKHPAPSEGTAGSFFKNISRPEERERVVETLKLQDDGRNIAAGLLLDRVEARGMAVGDAAVFEKHANIIVNKGAATARDVLELSHRMKQRVLDRFGIGLEREVIWLGAANSAEKP